MGRIEETLVAQTLGADMDAAVVVVAWAVAVGSSSAEVGDSGVVSSSNDSSYCWLLLLCFRLPFSLQSF